MGFLPKRLIATRRILKQAGRVSTFVESRIVDSPNEDNIDLWFEKVYAALFSCGFETFLLHAHAYEYIQSEKQFNRYLERFISGVARHSREWIETRWNEAIDPRLKLGPDLVTKELTERLHLYFSVGFKEVADKPFPIRFAISHSIFKVLPKMTAQLIIAGSYEPGEMEAFFEDVLQTCDALSKEIHERRLLFHKKYARKWLQLHQQDY